MYRNSLNHTDETTWQKLSLVAGRTSAYRLPGGIVAIGHGSYGCPYQPPGKFRTDRNRRQQPAPAPPHYTDEFHPETTRLNVVLADLHSGRFFGARGNLISDAIALMIFISLASGTYSFFLRRSASSTQPVENGYPAEERRKREERLGDPIPIQPALDVIDETAALAPSAPTAPQERAVAQASAVSGPLFSPPDGRSRAISQP